MGLQDFSQPLIRDYHRMLGIGPALKWRPQQRHNASELIVTRSCVRPHFLHRCVYTSLYRAILLSQQIPGKIPNRYVFAPVILVGFGSRLFSPTFSHSGLWFRHIPCGHFFPARLLWSIAILSFWPPIFLDATYIIH